MNTKNLKRWVFFLGGGVAGTLPLITLFFISIACYQGSVCPQLPSFILNFLNIIENTVEDNLIFSLIFLTPIFLLLSLLTYWAKEELFRAWFNFARWFVFVVIAATIFFEKEGDGGFGGLSILFIGFFYAILILGSLSAILHTYVTLRYQKQGKSTANIDTVKNIFNFLMYGSVAAVVVTFLYLLA